MDLRIRDLHTLPSLAMAQVIAGRGGLDQAVDSVSVLEWMDLKAFQRQFFLQNEIVITSFYSFRHDVASQMLAIRRLKESGEVGMILYYVGVILPKVDPRVIKLADELDFPILLMPPGRMNFRYSEAIQEIGEAIRKNRAQDNHFVQNALARLAGVPEVHRTVSTVLRMLSDQMQLTLLLADNHYGDFVAASWPLSLTLPYREILDTYMAGMAPAGDYGVAAEQAVNNSRWQHAKLLALAPREAKVNREAVAQAAQVLELTLKLWKSYEFDSFSTDLISAIINGEDMEAGRLLRRHGQGGFPYRALWLMTTRGQEESYDKRSLRLAAAYKALKSRMDHDDKNCHLAVFDNFLVGILGDSCLEEESFLAMLEEQGLFCAQIRPLDSLTAFHQAFVRALEVMALAGRVYRQTNLVSIQELHFVEELKARLDKGPEAVEESLWVLKPLLDNPDKGEPLIDTLSAYLIDCGSDLECTASLLFLHRNTVKYRLQKAEGILGFPFQRLPASMAVYRALALLRIKS